MAQFQARICSLFEILWNLRTLTMRPNNDIKEKSKLTYSVRPKKRNTHFLREKVSFLVLFLCRDIFKVLVTVFMKVEM